MRTVNLNDKPLSEFVEGDTIYISKLIRDYQYIFFCSFIELKRGIVHARIVDCEKGVPYQYKIGNEITARPKRCFLWGIREDEKVEHLDWNYCHWFENTRERA